MAGAHFAEPAVHVETRNMKRLEPRLITVLLIDPRYEPSSSQFTQLDSALSERDASNSPTQLHFLLPYDLPDAILGQAILLRHLGYGYSCLDHLDYCVSYPVPCIRTSADSTHPTVRAYRIEPFSILALTPVLHSSSSSLLSVC
jgi:hypothetical protein